MELIFYIVYLIHLKSKFRNNNNNLLFVKFTFLFQYLSLKQINQFNNKSAFISHQTNLFFY